MRKKLLALAAVMLTMSLSGCAQEGVTSLTALEASSPVSAESTPEAVTSAVSTTRTTTAAASATAAESTAPVPETPAPSEDVYQEYIYSSKAYFSEVNTVTSNDDLRDCLGQLDEVIDRLGSKLAFAYQNPKTGVTVTYNDKTEFQCCSTIKVPYVRALLENEVDLDELVTIERIYTAAAPEDGHITQEDYHKQYTVRTLIEKTVMLSDNTAYVNLIDRFGRNIFNYGQYASGINCILYEGYDFTMCSVRDMLSCYRQVYDYSLADKRGEWLIQLMLGTSFNYQISDALSSKYPVAHKYGADMETVNYHDCAICYADSPYILCIFTEQMPETDEANENFHQLALIFDKLNEIIVS